MQQSNTAFDKKNFRQTFVVNSHNHMYKIFKDRFKKLKKEIEKVFVRERG